MLHGFRCENCYSFAGMAEITIDTLKRVYVCGTNASGKSNLLKALSAVFWNISGKQQGLSVEPFAFDDNFRGAPVFSEIHFSLPEDGEYKYGYRIANKHIVYEKLETRVPDSEDGFVTIFERDGNDSVEIFGKWKSNVSEDLKAAPRNDKSALFLTLAGRAGGEPFSSVYNWCGLTATINLSNYDGIAWGIHEIATVITDGGHPECDPELKEGLTELLKMVDPCVSDILVADIGVEDNLVIRRHPGGNGKPLDFLAENESDGMQMIMVAYNRIRNALKNGGLVIADGLDAGIHPAIIRNILTGGFQDSAQNTKNAQIIVSAHNAPVGVHAGEVRLVKKDGSGRSSVIRPDDSGEEADYFAGAYSAGRFDDIREKG